jgi:hypothetical protein
LGYRATQQGTPQTPIGLVRLPMLERRMLVMPQWSGVLVVRRSLVVGRSVVLVVLVRLDSIVVPMIEIPLSWMPMLYPCAQRR